MVAKCPESRRVGVEESWFVLGAVGEVTVSRAARCHVCGGLVRTQREVRIGAVVFCTKSEKGDKCTAIASLSVKVSL
jgi:hypothetical protein